MYEEENSSDLDVETLVPVDESQGWVKYTRELAKMNSILTTSDYADSSLSSRHRSKKYHPYEKTRSKPEYSRRESRASFGSEDDRPIANDQDYYGEEAEQEEAEDISGLVNEDERLDEVRVQNALDFYKKITSKIQQGIPLNSHEIRMKKLFSVDKTYEDKANRMAKDKYNLTFQSVMNENDRRILKALGKDPGQEVCFGCMCPLGDDPTDMETDMRTITDMYFKVWSHTDDVPLAKNISAYVEENVLPTHRKLRKQSMMSDPDKSHLTDEQMDAMLPQNWSPASVYAHFNYHIPHPMAVLCREIKRLLVAMNFLWGDGCWSADVFGREQRDELNIEKFKLYQECQKRYFELQKIKPEGFIMPDIHSQNLIKAQGVMSRRVTASPTYAKLYNL